MTAADLVLSDDQDGVRCLVLNRPDKLNALNPRLIATLRTALADAEADPAINAVVLAGAGRSFCAGVDTAHLGSLRTEGAVRAHAEALGGLLGALGGMATPVVAAVHGYALGAGAGLVSACPLAVAETAAVFGYPEAGRGVLPALVVPPLVAAVGRRLAYDLLVSGRRFGADEAYDIGLVTRLAEGPALPMAMALAGEVAGLVPGLAGRIGALVRDCADRSLADGLDVAVAANIRHRLGSAG